MADSLEPCPFCGCPSEKYDGHVCEDYTSGCGSLWDALDRAARLVREAELEIVMHPDDVTDDIRAWVAEIPLCTLRESRLVVPGTAYTIRPGAFDKYDEDGCARSRDHGACRNEEAMIRGK